MHLRTWLLFLATLLGAGCGKESRKTGLHLSEIIPEHVMLAESVTSTVANELGAITGPPTPGTLIGKNCIEISCLDDHDAQGTEALFRKTALGCRTKSGALDGTVFMRVSGIPEFNGCATRTGPFVFKRWPPTRGQILFAIGQQDLFSESPADMAPPNTVERIDDSKLTRNWGQAAITFNGTRDAQLSVDYRAQRLDSRDRTLDPHANRFDFATTDPIALHMDTPWNSSARALTGQMRMIDHSRQITTTLSLSNVNYRKERCCHPIAGELVATTSVSPHAEAGGDVVSFRLVFGEICGQTILYDSMGHPQAVSLPECAF